MAEYSTEERENLASKGHALKDGSFPIANVADLKNAIRAIGRAKDPAAAKALIKKRAAALGESDVIPENWKLAPDDYVVAFALDGSGDSGISKPFEILRVGTYKRGTRTVPVTSDDLDQAVANFARWKSMGQEIPVDYDHAFNEGREAPAAGWYASLERKGDSLWASVAWNAKAREDIANKAYRFFSPEFTSTFTSETGAPEGFTILAGALTNRPFLRGMTPVALSQEVEDEILVWAVEKVEEERERVADTQPEVTIIKDKDGNEIETFKVEIDGTEQTLTGDEIVALHQKAAKADEAEEKAKQEAAKATAATSQVETLSTRVDTMEKDVKDRDFREIFSAAKREGRVDSKEETETTWRETFDALGPEKTKALIAQVPPETVPVSAQGRSGQGDQSAAPKGMHSENFAINQKVEAFMAEHPDKSFNEALAHVQGELEKAGA